MKRAPGLVRRFPAFGSRPFRQYMSGQALSLIGTWMQVTAQSWFVLSITHSASALSVIIALQTVPVLVLGPYAGVIADRFDRRRLMIASLAVMGAQALALGLLSVWGVVKVWEIGGLALILGINAAIEGPLRQTLMMELVGLEQIRSAVSLYSTVTNAARMIGPAVAGLLISSVGDATCFLLNAASFVIVIRTLMGIDRPPEAEMTSAALGAPRMRDGLRYVGHNPQLLIPLAVAVTVGCLAMEFPITLPDLAATVFHIGSSGYGAMMAAMGGGAVLAGLRLASGSAVNGWQLMLGTLGLGVALCGAVFAPDLAIELATLAFTGAGCTFVMASSNAILQQRSAPEMRGRVMALWTVAFQGTAAVGGPIVGAVISGYGARAGVGVGAAACLLAGTPGVIRLRSRGITRSTPARVARL